MKGLDIPFAGFMDAFEHEILPLLWARSEPCGYVNETAVETIAGEILQGIAEQCLDAVYPELHGAMVTRAFDDAEAELLARIRKVTGPELPLVTSFDLHAALSPEMCARAARLLDRLLLGP